MTVRHILGFENNQEAMQCLHQQWAERRNIESELGVECTTRYFVDSFFGANSGTMTVQYEYADLAAMQKATDLRSGNARLTELNQELIATGFQLTVNGIATEATPE